MYDEFYLFLYVKAYTKSGNDLLSHALRRSTIGAKGFNDRVRNGIEFRPFAMVTRP
jgi:hypothetical protein